MIVLDGNIGAGKTTISRLISEEYNIPLHEELLSNSTTKLLGNFYNDMTRWAFTLQVHFLNERFKMLKNNSGIYDRSIYGDLIFAAVLHQDGHMTDQEYEIYTTLFSNMEPHIQKPDLLIYLDTTPEKSLERIQNRGRESEKNIPLSYLEKLDNEYRKWLSNYDGEVKIFPWDEEHSYDKVLKYVRSYISDK